MNKTATLNNGKNTLTVDCQNEKVFFNGNEVVKISMNFDDGIFLDDPYYCIDMVAFVEAENMQKYLDNKFTLYALVYKDSETNKEHLVVEEYGNWNEIGSWDSIALNTNDNVVVAYGINDGKRVNRIVMEKISLFGFSLNDINNADTINMGYGVCCYEC